MSRRSCLRPWFPAAAGFAVLVTAAASPAVAQVQAPAGSNAQDDRVVARAGEVEVTLGEVRSYLEQYLIPPDRREEAYQTAVNDLINAGLLRRFLEQQRVQVTPEEIDAEVDKIREQASQSGQDLDTQLASAGVTMSDLRDRIRLDLAWTKYLQANASDQQLRDYFRENEAIFTGTLVKASHILIRVEPYAPQEEKEAARRKLLDLKQKIEAGELSFAEAADRDSEDPGNQETPDGGNLGYFSRRGQYIEAFSKAAFDLKVGEISDPVETDYGYHLIQVTDRRPGEEITYETIREQVLNAFGQELRQSILEQARDQVEIEIEPMPDDLFGTVPGTPGATPNNP